MLKILQDCIGQCIYYRAKWTLTNRALKLGSLERGNLDFIKVSEFFLKARSITKAVQGTQEPRVYAYFECLLETGER